MINLSAKHKIKSLKQMGFSCFEHKYDSEYNIIDYLKNNGPISSIAGRIIMLDKSKLRGKISDYSGQLEFNLNKNKNNILISKYLDIGDIVGLGKISLNKEICFCDRITILTKSSKPIEFNKNINKYKFRHLAFILDDEAKKTIIFRNKVIELLRVYLSKRGFIEVDTPLLHPYHGDSISMPLYTKSSANNINFALASSPEIYLKKILVGGFNKVFTINKAFRDDIVDQTHLIEFLSIEYYMAYVDYLFMLDFTEKMLKFIVKKIIGEGTIKYKSYELDFNKKWDRISIHKSLKDMFNCDLFNLAHKNLVILAKKIGVNYRKKVSSGNIIIDIFNKQIGNNIVQPTFVYDFPKDASVMCYDITMAKEKKENKNILERFELYIAGMELANCYSELNEAEKQKEYFRSFFRGKDKKLKIDPIFYHALQTGLPPSSGVGFGIDRLLMVLLNKDDISDTTTFSTYHEAR